MVTNEIVDYGMIVGKVKAESLELTSNYSNDVTGVVRLLEIKEHGTKWRNNVSFDTSRIVTRMTNDVPFNIINNDVQIRVEQPLDAEFIFDCLDLTHKSFEPVVRKSFLAQIISDVMLNEAVRGVETTEQMLRVGKQVTVFGRIEKLPSTQPIQYCIGEPSSKLKSSFIISPLSREALINRLNKSNRTLKICIILFGSAGVLFGTWLAYKYVKEFLDKRKREREIAAARLQRLKNQRQRARLYDDELLMLESREAQSTSTAGGDQYGSTSVDQSKCVICLSNPRELILLDCGHVCMCMDCFERMTNNTCPICRQRFRTFMPCYLP